jgi:UDP-N-acetylmuramoyl-L-alanyl-D-glutamate--2,6-diaminopimelate ligase
MSAAYFGYPAEKLKTIGITGTKGKTTATYMIHSVLESVGISTGLIGTIETIIGEKHIPSENTTPESFVVQQYFAEMVENGCQAVVMEVSSQGLMLDRVAGFQFDYGVFTNLSADHIGPNEHKDFDDYVNCKAKLFKNCRQGFFNIDDEYAEKMIDGCTCEVKTYGVKAEGNDADLQADNIHLFKKPGILGVAYDLSGAKNMKVEIDVPGKFSVYNSLAAIAICLEFTDDEAAIRKALAEIRVKGRVEILPVSPKYTLMIDYAHNAMSLESLLKSLREYEPHRIVTLFGCGGNRDRNRRFEMGEVSSRLSDLSIITSDNPRDEEPMAIIEDILTGVKKADGKYVTIPDRKEAIKYAIEHGEEGDLIILAGKGHEDYQIIKGVKYHMDERELVAEVKAELGI